MRVGFPADRKSYTGHYDYEEDSDLEEDDDDEILEDEPTEIAMEKPRNNSDVIVIESSDAKSSGPSGIISVSDPGLLFSEPSDPKGETGTSSFAHVGKVVVIEDVVFITYVGFLHSLYML